MKKPKTEKNEDDNFFALIFKIPKLSLNVKSGQKTYYAVIDFLKLSQILSKIILES